MSVVNMERCPLSASFNVEKIYEEKIYERFFGTKGHECCVCVCVCVRESWFNCDDMCTSHANET